LIFRQEQDEHQSNVLPTKIRGIWFHDGSEREEISSLLDRVVKSLAQIADLEEEQESRTQNQINSSTIANQQLNNSHAAAALLASLQIGEKEKVPMAESHLPQQPDYQNLTLDKKSLQLSLMSLLHDERFIDIIHTQYLKVVRARASREAVDRDKK